jgi:L-asparagine oxygenase
VPTELDAHDVVAVETPEAEAAWSAAGEIVRSSDVGALPADELADAACAIIAALPPRLLRAVHAYRSEARGGDALLVRGLLPDEEFGRTPAGSAAPLEGAPAQRAALLLLGVMLLLGEPFNFRTLYRGRLVQHVVPVATMEFTQTSESSSGSLDWHVEDGFSPDRCDYVGLLCLRGDERASTEFAAARDVRLPDDVRRILGEARFEMSPDTAHELEDASPTRTPVLFGPDHATEICYDAHYLKPASAGSAEDAAALRALGAELDRRSQRHVLARGDLLVLDNRRVVHARTPFAARHDGTDRWLLRTMVCASLPRFRRHGRRII